MRKLTVKNETNTHKEAVYSFLQSYTHSKMHQPQVHSIQQEKV